MNDQSAIAPTLFELLARQWDTGASIQSVLFNGRQNAVAYVLDNGSAAIAHVADSDPAERRIHVDAEDGRQTIRPRSKSPKPLVMIEITDGGPVLLGTLGETEFVAGAADGPFYRISPTGDKIAIDLQTDEAVTSIDDCPASGQFASASGSTITVFDRARMTVRQRLDLGVAATSIRFSPDGKSIAAAHETGLTVWDLNGSDTKKKHVAFGGGPTDVNWSPDGNWLATPLADGGFQLISLRDERTQALTGYPAPVNSIVWNRNANAIVTSGAFRVAAWSMDQPPIETAATGALETGKPGFVPVSAVSCHPDRNLVAAGYDNGFLSIMQIGGRDELVLNSEGQGAIRGLVWSDDGRHIACGAGKGLAAIVSVPPQMFK